MYYIFIIGTAGSGKTTLTKALQDYLLDNELDAAAINLDPAVENLPYTPDFDIRDYVDAFEVMEKYNLGPNSSLIASVDMALVKAAEMKDELNKIEANYVIVDTPGQIELFAFRNSGRLLSALVAGENKAASVFLLDSFLAKEARSYVSLLLLSASVKFRLELPQVNVISKIDLISQKELENILNWSNGEELIHDLGYVNEYSEDLINSLLETLDTNPIPVSAVTREGLDDLYAELQKIFAGGEDFETEEPNPRL